MQNKSLTLLSLFLLVVTLPYQLKAQDESIFTSLDSTDVFYFTSSLENFSFNKLNSIDTALFRFQQYDPGFKNNSYYASLGNVGLPSKNLVFTPSINEGFNYKKSYLDLYSYHFDDVQYYYLIKPYTEITYVTGPAKEQRLQLIHSQNIAPRINLSLKTIFLNSPGAYNRLRADDKNVFISSFYTSKNRRYGIAASYIHDKFVIEESGGIKYDSIFTQNLVTIRRQIDPSLIAAKSTIIKGGISFNQYFNIGVPPSKSTDSLGVVHERKGFRFGRLSHSFKYERKKIYFEDSKADTAFFQQFGSFIDTNLTNDSINIKTIENEFKWSNLDYETNPQDKPVYFYLALKQRLTNVIDTFGTISNTEIIPNAGLSIFLLKKFRLNANAYYIIGDNNNGDKYLNIQAIQNISLKGKDYGTLEVQATYKRQSPDWFYEYHQGNVFQWTNSFEKENISSLNVAYRNTGLTIGAKYLKIDNYIYLNEQARPSQLSGSQKVGIAYLNYVKNINKWNFDLNLIYQKTSGSRLRLPKFIANASVSLTQKFLQNVALLQPGIEIFYNSNYFADAYMPMHQSFYLQNTQVLGNYIYVDIFLNVRIKRTIFFLKLNHVNAGYTGFNYMMIPGYPMPDRGLKFGLTWKFYD